MTESMAASLPRSIPSQAVACPVAEVTLMEDRARIVRRGSVSLPAGQTRVVITEVAGVIADKTLRAILSANTSAKVLDTRVKRERRILEESAPESQQQLNQQLRELNQQQKLVEATWKVVKQQLTQLQHCTELGMQEIAQDVSLGRNRFEAWGTEVSTLAEEERALREKLLELEFQLQEIKRKGQVVSQRIRELQSPNTKVKAELIVDLLADQATEIELTIEYIVPNACWRPYHRVMLMESDPNQIAFHCEACVWQNTGEDWTDAQLFFSTRRPSLGAEPPRLASDYLALRPRSKTVRMQTREQRIQSTGKPDTTTEPEVPGIEDGGEVLQLRSPTLANIPSNGRPYRVGLFSFQTESKVEWVAMPEIVAAVLVQSTQTNPPDFPLLAGPVDLIRRGGLIGRTHIQFVAKRQEFTINWGPDAASRVNRELNEKQDDAKMFSNWTEQHVEVTNYLSNLGDTPQTILLRERVPVSEIEQVRIKFHPEKTTNQLTPDEDGFLQWTVSLGPYEHRHIKLVYTVRKHSSVRDG